MEKQRFVRKNKAMYDAARRQENKRTRRTVFYVFLFLFVSLIFLAVCVAVFLNVSEVKINGNEKYTYEQIIEYVPINIGDNIYAFDSDEIEAQILQNFPYVGAVEIKRDLPTIVEINITEETPYYATDLAGDAYIFSSNMKVLECLPDTDNTKLGLVSLSINNVRRCIVGSNVEFVSERNNAALMSLYQEFTDNYIEDKIKSIDFASRFDISFNYDDRFEVYIGDTDNIDIKIRFLVAIINELEPDATGLIDVSNPQEASFARS